MHQAAFLSPSPLSFRRNECSAHVSSIHSPCKLSVPSARNRATPQASLESFVANSGEGSSTSYRTSVRHPDLRILTRVWEPPSGAPLASMLVIPGFQWHSGWFTSIGQALSNCGVLVLAVDLLSTGRADDIGGIRGLTYEMNDHISDLQALVKFLEEGLPKDAPLFVLGESSGAITTCVLSLQGDISKRVKGWILCAPALQIFQRWLPPVPIVYLSRFIARFLPLFPSPRRLEREAIDLGLGTESLAKLAKEDPLVLLDVPFPLATLRARFEAMDIVDEAVDKGSLTMENVLVVHNEKDPCAIFEASERLVARVAGNGKLVEPGGNAHTVLLERDEVSRVVLDEIIGFVQGLV